MLLKENISYLFYRLVKFNRFASLGFVLAAFTGFLFFSFTLPAHAMTINETQKILASDGAPVDLFGEEIVADGDALIVGAQLNDDNGGESGSVYLYKLVAGTWIEQAKLLPSDGGPGAQFGSAIAIDGNTVAVGSFLRNKVYIFDITGASGTLNEVQIISPPNSTGYFGQSLGLDDDTLVIGASLDQDNGLRAGAVYVYENIGGTWSFEDKLFSSEISTEDLFGRSVTVDNGRIISGSYRESSDLNYAGAAYVFEEVGGVWTETKKLIASDARFGDSLGGVVAIEGTVAAVSSARAEGLSTYSGAVYMYDLTSPGSELVEFAKLVRSTGNDNEVFGQSLDFADSTVIVGSGYHDVGANSTGAAFTYDVGNVSGVVTEDLMLVASDREANDFLGWQGIAVSDGVGFVQGRGDDDNGTEAGAVYVFNLTTNTAPVIDSVAVPTEPVAIANQPINVDVEFTDPDSGDSHTCEIDYGDGTSSGGDVNGLSCEVLHTYAEPGVYTITVTITDEAGESDEATAETMIVIYDPSGGFVTGGGWIDSPEGAFKADETLTGKANFGFVSKYKKGANVPTGNTEFQFKAGNLNFHSSEYDWLVINQGGTNAQFKGSGTINGEGDYNFMLWAGDDSPDTFRIKINETGGGLVYDNGFDQAIGGGSIKIHQK